MMKISILIFCFSLHSWATWSKQPDDNLKVELGAVAPNYNFEIKSPAETSSSLIKYQPHSPSKTALGFSYRNIGASVSSSNPTSDDSNIQQGKTKSTDLQFRFFGKRTYEFFYQSYEGYYIENSADVDATYSGSSNKILRPDIKTKNYGFNFYWNINDKDFSQAIAYDQMGTQKQSAWGLSWLLHASQSSIEGDSELVPTSKASSFGQIATIKHIMRTSLAGGVGIGGIASWNNLYLAGLLALGLGTQNISYQDNTQVEGKDNVAGTYVSARLGLGYNGPKNVIGIQLLNDAVNTTILKGQITGTTTEFKLFYAYRFDGVNIPPLNYISSWLD